MKGRLLTTMLLSALALLHGATGLADGNTLSGSVTIVKSNGVAKNLRSDVVVYLEGESLRREWPVPAQEPQISQRARKFRPRVLPILKGTSVAFPNDDKVLHNVFSVSPNQAFDLGNYEVGGSRSVTFANPGVNPVFCNLHGKMVAYVLIMDNPFFAKTDADGQFTIAGVPDGSYKVRVWSEFGEPLEKDITLSGGAAQKLDFTVVETRSFVQHLNKFGRPYRDKY